MTEQPEKFQLKWKAIAIVMIMVCASVLTTAYAMGAGNGGNSIPVVIESGSGVETASYIIYKDGDYTCAKNGTTGRIESRSANDSIAFQYAIDESSGLILVRSGTYNISWMLDFDDNTDLRGESRDEVVLTSTAIPQYSYGLELTDVENCAVGSLTLTGKMGLRVRADAEIAQNITVNNVMAKDDVGGTGSAFAIVAINNSIVRNITMIDCVALGWNGYGFLVTGTAGGTDSADNIRFERCSAIECGKAADRASIWVTGFNLAENINVSNIFVIECLAQRNYESGFSIEVAPIKDNIVMRDCRAIDNGIDKVTPTYANGFTVTESTTVINCYAENNAKSGFYIKDTYGRGKITIVGCRDYGSSDSFTISDSIGQIYMDNCVSDVADDQGISALNSRNVVIKNLQVNYPQAATYYNNFGTTGYLLSNSSIEIYLKCGGGSSDYAIALYGFNCTLSGSILTTADNAILIAGSKDIHVTNMLIDSDGQRGIYVFSNSISNILIDHTTIKNRNTGNALAQGINNAMAAPVTMGPGISISGYVTPGGGMVGVYNYACSHSGTATLLAGQTYIVVNHSMLRQPTIQSISVTPQTNLAGVSYWISNVGATSFRINIASAAGGNVLFSWTIEPDWYLG